MKRILLCLILLGCWSNLVVAQEQDLQDLGAALEAARELATQYATPTSLEQERWQSAVEARIQILQELIQLGSDLDALPDAESVAERTERALARLDSMRSLAPPAPVTLTTPDELSTYERELAERESARAAVSSARGDLDSRVARDRADRTSLPERSSAAQNRLAALAADDAVSSYRRDTIRLELQWIAEQRDYLAEAIPLWEALAPALEAERAAEKIAYDRARARATEAREQAAALREQAVQAQLIEAESRAREADATKDPLESFRLTAQSEAAAATARAGLIRSEATRIADQLTTEKDLLADQKAMKDRLDVRVNLGAGESGRALRDVLRRIREIRMQIDDVARPVATERLAEHQVEFARVLDRIWVLQVPGAVNQTLADLLDDVEGGQTDEARLLFEEMVHGEGGLLSALRGYQGALDDVVRADTELLGVMEQREAVLGEMGVLARQALLWTRSLPPFSLDAFRVAATELGGLTEARTVIDVPASIRARPRLFAIVLFGILVGIFAPVWARHWKLSSTDESGTVTPHYDLAFVQRLVRGLVWAGGLTLASWSIAFWIDAAHEGRGQPPLLLLFWGVGWFLLLGRLAALILDSGGILSRQLASSQAAATQALRAVRILTTGGVFLLAPALVSEQPPYNWERVPQVLTIGWMFAFGFLFRRVLSSSSPVVMEWSSPGTPSRRLLRGLGVVVPVISAILVFADLAGYRSGAEALFENLIRLVVALLILLVLYRIIEGTSHRISRAVSRRIIQERGWKEAAKAEEKIETFVRRTAATVAIVIAAIILREAWSIGDTLGEMLSAWNLFDSGDGDWVTMMDIVDASVLLILGIVLSQALTKTWELVIAPLRGNEVAGSEYATLTMIRYLVLGIAVAAALLTLNFSLARLGWLLTALSVGLGFGLQEIVANFVSGLILMVERPVRVGDVVTVGTTAGVVDRISIRATMVTNWDRQTIVVPNRNFITQEVTNWTRTDRIVRRTLQVGVAYGTDVQRVLAILDELVTSHPKVLRNPAHRVWFQGFGASSLDFEVWFYASFDDGLAARSELYAQVCDRLVEEGIQIPFPQRDVWMRSAPASGDPPPDAEMPRAESPEDQAE